MLDSSDDMAQRIARDKTNEMESLYRSTASEVEDIDIHKVTRLTDLDFTDINFDVNTGDAFMRGLQTSLHETSPPIVAIPSGVMSDVERLMNKVVSVSASHDDGRPPPGALGMKASDSFFLDSCGCQFRVQKIYTIRGESFTLRRTRQPPRLIKINGMLPIVRNVIDMIGQGRSSGSIIILCGKTGEGKTTTLLSILQEFLIVHGDIGITIEEPVETIMPEYYGTNRHGRLYQQQVINGDYAGAIKISMRETPRWLMISEIRDRESAIQAIQASINGHIVLASVHAGSTLEGMQRILSLASNGGVDRAMAQTFSMGIAGIIHQKLHMNVGIPGRFVDQECLFFGNDDAGIRAQTYEAPQQLRTEIERQNACLREGRLPTRFSRAI